jgi:Sec-independent protein translocase protein TatA
MRDKIYVFGYSGVPWDDRTDGRTPRRLIIFGPRKLPQLGRSLSQAISQFRRASDDFKRTWEAEAASIDVPRPAEQPAVATSALPEQPV